MCFWQDCKQTQSMIDMSHDSHLLNSTMSPQLDQELRHVSASRLAQLSTIIDEAKAWKDLLNELSVPLKLTLESIYRIKSQLNCDKSPTLALLNHWAITGRRRPTIEDLIKYLRVCQLARAEEFVWREILVQTQDRVIKNSQMTQPNELKAIEPHNHTTQIDDEFKFHDVSGIIAGITELCPRYSFKSIYESTNRFCHRPFDFATKSGARVGDGRFSSVFLARTYEEQTATHEDERPAERSVVAAKLLKSECNMNYLVNEINLARKINHQNILELLGISIGRDDVDGQARFLCLIYPYMQNGSLLDCLSHGLRCNNGQQIPWQRRLDTATQVVRGIGYLHSYHEGIIIHRDIKTANILIDSNLNPKLGDFTLVRQLESHKPGETQYSQNVIGTSVYMPPEAFRGDISTKFDIFSFGIVMLELLTGLRPFNDKSNEDLLTYISDKLSDLDDSFGQPTNGSITDDSYGKFLLNMVDRRAGDWDSEVTKAMFKMALKATESRKKDRPEANEILCEFEKLFISLRSD